MKDEAKVAIVEDLKATREGLTLLINGTSGYRVTGAYESVEDAVSGIQRETPDVVLMDIHLPGISGIEGVRQIKTRHPSLPILMLTVFNDDRNVFDAICAGVCGYLLKDTPPASLLSAIRDVVQGGAPMSLAIARKVVTMFQKIAPRPGESGGLSPRELEVLRLLAEGHSYKTAAAALSLSVDTVRYHVRSTYEKLHVHSKPEAVTKAMRSGLLR